ncbi:hypothetical protein, partial [Paenibacillus sp. KS1]|uniref:hypothetical protein n=1 Tax=Paenibacillus sp. KS1 TaxID=1849249 RepID=UPI0015866F22
IFSTDVVLYGDDSNIGFSIPNPYGIRIDSNFLKKTSSAEYKTSLLLFVNSHKLDKEKEVSRIFTLIQKFREIKWITKHSLEIHFFDEGLYGRIHNMNNGNIKSLLERIKDSSLWSINISSDDVATVRNFNQLAKQIMKER